MADVFVDAAACGDFDEVKRLLADPKTTAAQVNAMDKDGRSSFHYACLNDDVKLLKVLLVDERVDVELRSPKGDTCMHLASVYACLEVLKVLLKDDRAKVLLDAQNKWGETPLHLCAGSGDKAAGKAAMLLLGAGASVLIVDQWKRGPLDMAKANGENLLVNVIGDWLAKQDAGLQEKVKKQTAAYMADASSAPSISVDALGKKKNLLLGGALGNALAGLKKVETTEKKMFSKTEGRVTSSKRSSMKKHDAKSHGKILSKLVDFPGDVQEVTAHLKDKSIDPAGSDAFGLCAMHKFASWNKVELLELLMPCLTKEQINQQDPEGKTALHWACEMASVAVVKQLVAHPDVDRTIKDKKGRTPLDIVNTGTGSVVERLKKALQA